MHRSLKHRPLAARTGISLLEVLISMFIILIGLLGVAAMLPVGKLEIAAATQSERGGSVARAAFRELKIRRLLDPSFWRTSTATGAAAIYNPGNIQPFTINGTNYDTLPPIVIDPIGISPPGGLTTWGTTFPTGGFPRITFASTTSAWADSIFRSQDDLKIDVPKNPDIPSVQQWERVNFSDPSSAATKRQSAGDYSWLATVVPDPHLYNQDIVTVSIAVFYKRQLFQDATLVPAERRCNVNGMLGTSVILGTPASTVGTPEQYTMVKPGHWLMMTGFTMQGSLQRWTARWYRVVNVDDINGNQRTVTLAGADWPIPAANTSVVLVDNVINVIEKNVRLEIPENPWKQ